ncbi:potassium channel family protein [Pseudodesulfovibrio tunisiensis]|uniref:potassium channel family protein n=1 Tax=Pseudodesulfovibrio tunisiensis TaxID=463192 RepID=UPI001FB3567D|nr:TrkA family potassium uptake protein [Pseudodesulfovibrio tunisiensis]
MKMEIGVVGLGKFGLTLAKSVHDLGHSVVGVDAFKSSVDRARPLITQVYQADGTDKKALEQLGFSEFDHAIVSTGESMEASILVSLNLLELGVKKVWVKAVSAEHEKILKRIGVHYVVFPEQFVAEQLAHRLAVPGMMDYLAFGSDIITREIVVDEWQGSTLRDLNLTNTFQVQVVAYKHNGSTEFSFVPKADLRLEQGDTLVLLGKTEDVMKVGKY